MGKNAVIIVAAGRGERAGITGKGPKQYRKIGSESVFFRAANAFVRNKKIDLIQPVIHSDDHGRYLDAVPDSEKILAPVEGGQTRQQSVFAGLRALEKLQVENVLVHDAARPFVTGATITTVLDAIDPGTCALPAHAQGDTLKRVDDAGYVEATVPRERLFCAQTPQGFRYDEILSAHREMDRAGRLDFSDDAAVAEAVGMKVRIVPSPAGNLKITTPEDLFMANERVFATLPDIRTGNGYDVHALVDGESVWLCGIEIPFDRKLAGHSDADVGLHAVTDALLGALGARDIGDHFPPGDEQWRNTASDVFLRHAVQQAASAGATIRHLDVTLICEAPRIGPHRERMRERIAEIAAIEKDRVSVKATTNEGLGFVGRQEGIAAIATATVAYAPSGQED